MTTQVEKWLKLNANVKHAQTPPKIEEMEEAFEALLNQLLKNEQEGHPEQRLGAQYSAEHQPENRENAEHRTSGAEKKSHEK